jgi:choline transport protein
VVYFSIIVLCSWEAFAITFQFALLNGGPSSMVYGCILVAFGATAVAFSMAEMASMYTKPCLSAIRPSLTSYRDPTVGAQYRWSANFAPFAPRFWGLLQGTGDALNAWLEMLTRA